MPEPVIQAGDAIIEHCPLCSAKFAEPAELNVKHTCPTDGGGCGRIFLLRVFN